VTEAQSEDSHIKPAKIRSFECAGSPAGPINTMSCYVESRPLDDSNGSEEISIGLDDLCIPSQTDTDSELCTVCTTCGKITLPKLQSARFHDHKPYPALKSSASHCPMCMLLLMGLEKAWAWFLYSFRSLWCRVRI
jgi:hypothetical protein